MPHTKLIIHDVEMWDHKTVVIEADESGFPPYERITITIQTKAGQTEIVLDQDVSCRICGKSFEIDDQWEKDLDKWSHPKCISEHQRDMDDWCDRYATRAKERWTTTD